MKTSIKILILACVTLIPTTGVVIYGIVRGTADANTASQYTETDWRLLRGLDYRTGKASPELAKLDGQLIKVPGFVVPLDDDDVGLSEFLLVPSPQACIHVPPPPPNQMIMVRMKSSAAPKRSWGPVWLKGRLKIGTAESKYGKIAFTLEADSAEPYSSPEVSEQAAQAASGGQG